jgi:hypothetical protein
VVFTISIFTSAFLLFLIQPLFGKMALPLLGGSPAVWNTCMLFFQTTLLAGYAYAHLSTRLLGVRRQAALHFVVLCAALLTLPIGIASGWYSPSVSSPALWLLGLLTVSIGLPFFVLSSSGPLFQKWFANTRHPDANNPYFLYAASNLGSLLALVAYPLLLEPRLTVWQQSWVWSAGFGLLTVLVASCGLLLWREYSPERVAHVPAVERKQATISPMRRLRWLALAFVPSSLLLGTTTYITTDIAAVPFLWVLPLALYLLTFVLVFARNPPIGQQIIMRVHPFVLIPLVAFIALGASHFPTPFLLLHLIVFFVSVMICHGELAADRPSTAHLTEFYLWMSVGGALGGAFNVLIAPRVFTSITEYPLALVLVCLLRPNLSSVRTKRQRTMDLVLPLLLGTTVLGGLLLPPIAGNRMIMVGATMMVIGLSLLAFSDRPSRMALGVGAVFLAGAVGAQGSTTTLLRERTFFGTHRVLLDSDLQRHVLMHGTTVHGHQSLDPDKRLEPTTYYHAAGPVGQLFSALRAQTPSLRVAAIGLGSGTLACHGWSTDRWTFFEIDPLVERIARDPRYFTFLRDCPPPSPGVVLGDARLTLQERADAASDLIIVDAFSSDAIPVHLLTREAVDLYMNKLAPGGILAVHVSNRYLDLEPVLAGIQQSAMLAGLISRFRPDEALTAAGATPSDWVVLARSASDLGRLNTEPLWRELRAQAGVAAWTDDFSSIWSVMR